MKLIKNFCFIILLIFGALSVEASSIRNITVSYNKSYTDHISLSTDSRDMDLMVKFIFDENKNTLTVSLISYRSLFVFREDSRYKNIIHHNRLIPEDLPYVVEFPEKSRFLLSKEFRKSIPKPHKKYIFPRWITYNGLQPVPMKFKMINDYIEQTFDITNYASDVNIGLGYVIVMDKTPSKRHPYDYTLVVGKDLDLQYNIHIQRNPCFGMEAEIELATNALSAVTEAYVNFKSSFASSTVDNEKELQNFSNMKSVLLKQFQSVKSDSPCPELKELWDRYDHYVDSISAKHCELKVSKGEETEIAPGNIDSSLINSMARQIDKNVSRWLISKDNVERADLVDECDDIINEINGMIGKSSGATPEQRKAISIFRQAEAYYRSTCGKKK